MINLYGSLAKHFEKKYKATNKLPIRVSSLREAMLAMEANFPGFKRLLRKKGHYHVVRGSDLVQGRTVLEPEISMNFGESDWHILPVAMGGKQGVVQTIIGAVLVIVGAVATAFGYGAIGVPMMKMGVALMIGGIAQMMAPSPNGSLERERPEERPSYLFSGPVNSVEPGTPIGVGYGEFFVGTVTVSGGVRTEKI